MPSSPRSISITTGTMVRLILLLIGAWALWMISQILLYIFVAILLAGLIYPWASWAARHHIPRGLAVVLFYIFLFGLLALVFAMLVPVVLEQSKNLIVLFGGSADGVNESLSGLKQLSLRFYANGDLFSSVSNFSGQIQQVAKNVIALVMDIFGGVLGVFIVLVLSFYIIVEDPAIRGLAKTFVPTPYQDLVSQIAWQTIEKLGGWLRGQLILGFVVGLLYFIGFSIIGVPYALLLAILGGLLEFIPYVGPFLSAIPAIFLALTDSPWRALATLVLIIIIQQLENNLLVPKVMQKAVGLNPLVSIIALMVGASLFGIIGALFAIPLACALTVSVNEYMSWRKRQAE